MSCGFSSAVPAVAAGEDGRDVGWLSPGKTIASRRFLPVHPALAAEGAAVDLDSRGIAVDLFGSLRLGLIAPEPGG